MSVVRAEVAGLSRPPRRPLLGRVVDRGAITAAYVGIGMAMTMAVSFLLVIPIDPVYWLLSIPSGLLIGYYANARSKRGRGAWGRVVANAVFAGVVTGLTLAAFLIGVKALFFAADDGYRDPFLGGRITVEKDDGRPAACRVGADCVYRRYLDEQPAELASAGVVDSTSFSTFYWAQQWSTAGLLIVLTSVAALVGGGLYGISRPKSG